MTNKQINGKWQMANGKFICLFAYLLICLFPKTADAAGLSLAVSPPILQIDAKPPANIKAPITIENKTDEAVDLDIVFKPFTAEKENGEVSYLINNEPGGEDPLIFQRMQILDNNHVVNKITLAPKQAKTLELHIGIPDKEFDSDYYFSVVFLSNQAVEGKNTMAETLGGIAMNVLLSIGEKEKPQGAIEEFSTPLFLEKGPVAFKVRVKNNSKHYIMPKGTILITNMFNQIVGKVDLMPVNILSEKTRSIPDILQSPSSSSAELTNEKMENGKSMENEKWQMANFDSPEAFWKESFLLGPYTATLTIALSDEGPIFVKTTRFIGLPIQVIIGVSIALILVIIVWSKVKNHLKPENR